MDDLISRQAAIDALSQYPFEKVVNCVSIIEELPSAQPEPCLDLIVSEIEETIRETKENGKHHEIHVRINGEMICFGLQLALDIIKEKRAERREE